MSMSNRDSGSPRVERRHTGPLGGPLLGSAGSTAAPSPMEPMAGVLYGTEETLDGCLHLAEQIENIMNGPGPEKAKEPNKAIKPILSCAFDNRTKAQVLHKHLSLILSALA